MRNLFGLELGLRLTGLNSDTGVDFLFGAGTPGGDSSYQDAAPIGSIYLRTNGSLYQKITSTNSTSDWELNTATAASIGKWRNERVRAVTNDTVAAGTRNLSTTPFSDDESPLLTASDFAVDDYVIGDADGTPALFRVSAVSAPSITLVAAANPLVADDTFIAVSYLPDSPGAQEGRAIVNYNGSVIVKLADIDWNFADGINMAAGYTAQNGTVTSADTVNSAIEKLDGNQQDLIALSGVAQGSMNLGTFTGDIILDNRTIKQALQDLETELVDTRQNTDDLITLSGVAENATHLGTFTGDIIPDNVTIKVALQSLETELVDTRQNVDDVISALGIPENQAHFGTFTGVTLDDNQTAKQLFQRIENLLEQIRGNTQSGITTIQTVDAVPHASVKAVKWLVTAVEEAATQNRQAMEVYAVTNGTNEDHTVFAKLKVGANFDVQLSVDISGADMRLRAASSSAGISVTARRIEVVKTIL